MAPSSASSFDSLPDEHAGPIGVALNPAAGPLELELVEATIAGAAGLGRTACVVCAGDDQSRLGVLLGIGNPAGLRPVFDAPPQCRRVIWIGEPLQPREEPGHGPLSTIARSPLMNYLRYPLRTFSEVPLPGLLARARASATMEWERARNTRELDELARRVDRVVVTSRDRRAILLDYGLSADAVPFGYAAAAAGPITRSDKGDRDLPIVSLGLRHTRVARRRSIVESWRVSEPRFHILDGVWGQERNEQLRRSKVVVNVARHAGDFVGLRLVLAIAAGAVVVSEPMTDPFPFVAGVHFVEAPLDRLLDTARELAADDPRRRRIVDAGQAMLTSTLSIASCLSRVLATAPTAAA